MSITKTQYEKLRIVSEQKFDIMLFIIGISLLWVSTSTGILLLTLNIASQYTAAQCGLYGKWGHEVERQKYDTWTENLNKSMIAVLIGTAIRYQLLAWNII